MWFDVKYMWIREVEIMDYEKIKKDANDILANLSSECSYILYRLWKAEEKVNEIHK